LSIDQLIELFELQRNFTRKELDESYKDLVQIWHPDKYPYNSRLQLKAEGKLKEINNAYAMLKEFLSKAEHSFGAPAGPGSGNVRPSNGRPRPVRPLTDAVPIRPNGRGIEGLDSSIIALRSVFHPTDFSEASKVAFGHALKIALTIRGTLSIMHVTPPNVDVDFSNFPEVRQTLERWGTLPAESSEADVIEKTGIDVQKVVVVHDDPVFSMRQFLERHPRDLTVLATRRHKEPVRWLRKSVAEPLARASDGITLFIPEGLDGFISHRDGSMRLRRILIPIDHRPRPELAIDIAFTLARLLGSIDCQFTLAYVGNPTNRPVVDTPTHTGWTWEKVTRQGDVVKEILDLERERSADLIVMTTQGHDGFLDALRGSTTERVLRGARCPLLAVTLLRGDGADA
jgi:nucleotide-binding universal stress UspA family protein